MAPVFVLLDAVAREEITVFPIKGKLPREKEPVLRLELSDEEREKFLASFDDYGAFRRAVRSVRPIAGKPHGEGPEVRWHFGEHQKIRGLFDLALHSIEGEGVTWSG